MKQILLGVLILSSLFLLIPRESNAQQIPPTIIQSAVTNNCTSVFLQSANNFVPATLQITHDETRDFGVQRNATHIGSLITSQEPDNRNYFVFVNNGTDTFTINVHANYYDGLEHIVRILLRSQNSIVFDEQYPTIQGKFCKNVIFDTAIPPKPLDIPSIIKQSEAGDFKNLIDQIVSLFGITGLLVIGGFIFNIIIFILLIAVWWSSRDKGEERANEKRILNSVITRANETISTMQMVIKGVGTSQMITNEAVAKIINEMKNAKDVFEVEIRGIALDLKNLRPSENKEIAKGTGEGQTIEIHTTEAKPVDRKLHEKILDKVVEIIPKKDEVKLDKKMLYKEYEKETTEKLRELHEKFRQDLAKNSGNIEARMRMEIIGEIVIGRLPK